MSTAGQDVPGRTRTPLPKRRRWGLRTLGCLVVAIFAMVVAGIQGFHTLGTFGCVVLGLLGAAVCSVRGMQDLLSLEWYRMRLVRRKPEPTPIAEDNWRVGGENR